MTDTKAPERIWAYSWAGKEGRQGQWDLCDTTAYHGNVAEYVRADLHDATVKQRDELAAEIERLTIERDQFMQDAAEGGVVIGEMRATNAALRAERDAALARAGAEPVSLRLSVERKIGMYGAAFDGLKDARAYTYDHQPGNVPAWKIGKALTAAAQARAGDYIDSGLAGLRELQEQGFGIFALVEDEEPQPTDKTALDKLIADARDQSTREVLAILHEGWTEDRDAKEIEDAILARINEPQESESHD